MGWCTAAVDALGAVAGNRRGLGNRVRRLVCMPSSRRRTAVKQAADSRTPTSPQHATSRHAHRDRVYAAGVSITAVVP